MVFLKIPLKIDLCERQLQKEKETSPCAGLLLQMIGPGRSQEPQAFSGLPTWHRGPRTWALLCCFPRHVSELDGKWGGQNSNQHLCGMLVPAVASPGRPQGHLVAFPSAHLACPLYSLPHSVTLLSLGTSSCQQGPGTPMHGEGVWPVALQRSVTRLVCAWHSDQSALEVQSIYSRFILKLTVWLGPARC